MRTKQPRIATASLAGSIVLLAGVLTYTLSTTDAAPAQTPGPSTWPLLRSYGQVDEFCSAAVAAEGAVVAVRAAAPAGLSEALDAAIAAGDDSAHRELLEFVAINCDFHELYVTASDRAFGGLPSSVPSGPMLITIENSGDQAHRLVVLSVEDSVTEPLDVLLARPPRELTTMVSLRGVAFVAPDGIGYGLLDLHPGRYIAMWSTLGVAALSPSMPWSDTIDAATHLRRGTIREFDVLPTRRVAATEG